MPRARENCLLCCLPPPDTLCPEQVFSLREPLSLLVSKNLLVSGWTWAHLLPLLSPAATTHPVSAQGSHLPKPSAEWNHSPLPNRMLWGPQASSLKAHCWLGLGSGGLGDSLQVQETSRPCSISPQDTGLPPPHISLRLLPLVPVAQDEIRKVPTLLPTIPGPFFPALGLCGSTGRTVDGIRYSRGPFEGGFLGTPSLRVTP